jgi:UDP-glucose 4-epimerase
MNIIGLTGSSGSLGKTILKLNKKKKFSCYNNDIVNRNAVFKWIEKNNIKVVIHLAAIVPIKLVNKDKSRARKVNLIGTKNIVDACIKNNVKWFFFASTSHVYKQSKKSLNENSPTKPYTFYGKTKLDAENYIIKNLKKKKINYCIGRIFSTANKNQKNNYLVPDLKKRIKRSKNKITLKNLNHYRDFISMSDINKIIFYLMKIKFKGIINIASGKKIYLKDLAKIILKKYNKKYYQFIDNKVSTSLIGNIQKLKKIKKFSLNNSIEKLIF